MNGSLIDTNILLDIATGDPQWQKWSEEQLRAAAVRGPLCINPIIYAELAPAFRSMTELDRWLGPPLVLHRLPLPYAAGWIAAQAFVRYRRSGGTKNLPLPDFYIGAHAELEDLALVTRDATRYQTYFPQVHLIAPP